MNATGFNLDPEMDVMVKAFENSREEYRPSKYWVELCRKNIEQLRISGYGNFKQTVALNYFTSLAEPEDLQVRFLKTHLPATDIFLAWLRAFLSRRHSAFTARQSMTYNFVTFLLWYYASRLGLASELNSLEEPADGNPLSVRIAGRRVSQDLVHSVLEFGSVTDGIGNADKVRTIMELGAGYGRTAHVFMKLLPGVRYTIVDIPPALYISQRYLSSLFPERKTFRFREFKSFPEVADEFSNSRLAFLLPSQMEMLPTGTADLFLAIDCLHEMHLEQIRRYFDTIGRLTKKYFYFRCWKHTKIPYDNVVLTEADYPALPHWGKVFWRDCELLTLPTRIDGKTVNVAYFEALFDVGQRADP